MKELTIELPCYEERRVDINTIQMIAERFDLDYDAFMLPFFTVYDSKKRILLQSDGMIKIRVTGKKKAVKKFFRELEAWIKLS